MKNNIGGESMNKKGLSAVLFLITFVAAYLFICFGIPGMRIKLEAEPMELFMESITHMALLKSVISLAAASAVAAIPLLFRKQK